jgi:release factor glutamine methyltransferase
LSKSISSKSIFNSIKEALAQQYGPDEAQSLAFIILKVVLGISRLEVLSNKVLETKSGNVEKLIQPIIERLLKREPIQYIIGETEFYGCKIKVNPSVLIPRPETEELVDLIIKENQLIRDLSFLDICTGSGCIPIAIKKNLSSNAFALDISTQALQMASINATLNEVEIEFNHCDILTENIPWTDMAFNFIVSNPPYVRENEKGFMERNVLDYEPHIALFVKDNDPLVFYKRIVELSIQRLKPNGKLYFEINEEFGQEVRELLQKYFFTDTKIVKDFFGKDRFVTGTLL